MLTLVSLSCTERVDVNVDQEAYARLVVEGEFATDTMAHKVILTQTEDYFSNKAPVPVSNAQVTIFNDEELHQLTETPSNSGVYFTAPDAYGTVGRDYNLRIELENEIGGNSVYTATSHIYPVNQLDSIALEYYDNWSEEGFWEVKCYVLDPPTEDYYMFHVYRNGVLVNDTIDQVFVVDDILYNGNYTNGIGVGYLDQGRENEKLYPGDKVTLRVARITEDYTDFLWQLQEQVSYQSPLFSGPPANVNGNISGGAFGFFGAYSTSYATTITPPLK